MTNLAKTHFRVTSGDKIIKIPSSVDFIKVKMGSTAGSSFLYDDTFVDNGVLFEGLIPNNQSEEYELYLNSGFTIPEKGRGGDASYIKNHTTDELILLIGGGGGGDPKDPFFRVSGGNGGLGGNGINGNIGAGGGGGGAGLSNQKYPTAGQDGEEKGGKGGEEGVYAGEGGNGGDSGDNGIPGKYINDKGEGGQGGYGYLSKETPCQGGKMYNEQGTIGGGGGGGGYSGGGGGGNSSNDLAASGQGGCGSSYVNENYKVAQSSRKTNYKGSGFIDVTLYYAPLRDDFLKQNTYSKHLYAPDQSPNEFGSLAVIVPPLVELTQESISIEKALYDKTISSSFVFYEFDLDLNNQLIVNQFVENINTIVKELGLTRSLIWLTNIDINKETVRYASINDAGTEINETAEISLSETLNLQLDKGIKIELHGSQRYLVLKGGDNTNISFSGKDSPKATPAKEAVLHLVEEKTGCMYFQTSIEAFSLFKKLPCGFQFSYSDNNKILHREFLPLFNTSNLSSNSLDFFISINPADIFNQYYSTIFEDGFSKEKKYKAPQTFFSFESKESLESSYQNNLGNNIALEPLTENTVSRGQFTAQLVFIKGTNNNLYPLTMVPEGDFKFLLPENPNHATIVCGLQATEYVRYKQDSILRFISDKPAHAVSFPLEVSSPLDKPNQQNAPLLDTTYTTSWGVILSNGKEENTLKYASQSKELSLYGQEDIIYKSNPEVLGNIPISTTIKQKDNTLYPLVPYSGFQPSNNNTGFIPLEVQDFERQIISPTRTNVLNNLEESSQSFMASVMNIKNEKAYNVITTKGLLVSIENEKWKEIILGRYKNGDHEITFSFKDPHNKLIEAFQASELFLVISNNKYLGDFQNKAGFEDWKMQANTGKNGYNDYRNIIIIKGSKGKLFDPDLLNESLVATTQNWTLKDDFAAPTTLDNDTPDPEQISVLSLWLQNYFIEASLQEDTGFASFNALAKDPNWTGVLVLRMDVEQIPDSLNVLKAGVKDPENFSAHHFGFSLSQIENEPGNIDIKDSSSFGLINYLDNGVDPLAIDKAIAPLTNDLYDFRLLSLKALFKNGDADNFQCYSQLTINELFGSVVKGMGDQGNFFNGLILKGTLQHAEGVSNYSFNTSGVNLFYLQSNIINKIEITSVGLVANPTANPNEIGAYFVLGGFIDFKILSQTIENIGGAGLETSYKLVTSETKNIETVEIGDKTKLETFDIFSYGNDIGEDKTGKGLKFNGLQLSMHYRKEKEVSLTEFSINIQEIRFNLLESKVRPNSLVNNFAMDIQSLGYNTQDGLAQIGFLPVLTDFQLSGIDSSSWYVLKFNINMGYPGDLAGKAGFNSTIGLAWSPQSRGESYYASVGISLPGTGTDNAKLISIQNVLKLSVGNIRLTKAKNEEGFLLMLTEIALKFLGLLKIPPNGSTVFYLFGNPEGSTEASGLGWYAMYKKDDKNEKESIQLQKKNINKTPISKL